LHSRHKGFKSSVEIDAAALTLLVANATVCAQFGTPLVQHEGSPDSDSINRCDPAVKSYGNENVEVRRMYALNVHFLLL
jgi:hypothetical protein